MFNLRKTISLIFLCGLLSACSKHVPAPFYKGNKIQTRADYLETIPVYYKTKNYHIKTNDNVKSTEEKKERKYSKYIVQKGDTLYSISRDNNISLSDLIAANNLRKPYNIYVGQELSLSYSNNVVNNNIDYNNIPKRSSQKFAKPLSGNTISSFGSKKDGLKNDGINIAAQRGAPVKAAESGVVVYSSDKIKGLGNIVLVKHDNNWITAYGHLDKSLVEKGDMVKRGSTIGTVGDTGSVSSPQLHFEIRKNGKPVNPDDYF